MILTNQKEKNIILLGLSNIFFPDVPYFSIHNLGGLLLYYILSKNTGFHHHTKEKQFEYYIYNRPSCEKLYLFLGKTGINNSGQDLFKFTETLEQTYKIIICFDDVTLETNRIIIDQKCDSKHNGVRNVAYYYKNFLRIRIGCQVSQNKLSVNNYVLKENTLFIKKQYFNRIFQMIYELLVKFDLFYGNNILNVDKKKLDFFVVDNHNLSIDDRKKTWVNNEQYSLLSYNIYKLLCNE